MKEETMKKSDGITKTSPRIADKTAIWYRQTFDSLNFGLEFVLEAFPSLYRQTIQEFKGNFLRGELMLLIDVMNGTIIMPQHSGWSIPANVSDGIALDALDKKWEIDGDALNKKLAALTTFELTCLELWVQTFWNQDDHSNIEEYVAAMV